MFPCHLFPRHLLHSRRSGAAVATRFLPCSHSRRWTVLPAPLAAWALLAVWAIGVPRAMAAPNQVNRQADAASDAAVNPQVDPAGQDHSTSEAPPRGLLSACVNLIRARRYDDARALLEPVLERHSDWARGQFVFGLTFHKEKRYREAKPLLEKALELNPSEHQVRVFLGWCHYYLGELDEAQSMFETYLQHQPGYDDAIFALGLIAFDRDRIDEAQTRFERVIALAEDAGSRGMESKARARLADVHVRKGRLEPARAELERSIALNPDNYETYFKLARVLHRIGDTNAAREAMRKHREVKERIRPTLEQGDRRPGE